MAKARVTQQNRANSAAARAKSRNRVKLIASGVILTCVVAAAVLLCVFMFFKVENVEVTGSTIYTSQQIIEGSDINQGDNLIFVNSEEAEEKLKKAFPYIEDVKISKKVPSTLLVEITQAQVAYSVPYQGAYIYASKTGKILEVQTEPMSGRILVSGGEVVDQDGQIVVSDISCSAAFKEIAAVLAEKENSGITEINVTNIHDIYLIYDGRLKMELGSAADLTYKLNYGLQIVENSGVGPDERGTLNLSLAKDTNKAYFQPEVLSESSDASQDEGDSGQEGSGESGSSDSESSDGSSSEESSSETGEDGDSQQSQSSGEEDGDDQTPSRGYDIPDA